MPCATTPGKRKKPPKAWFEKMYAEVKSGNPEYSDEQVRATVGAIWYRNLSARQRAKAKSMDSDLMQTLWAVRDRLEKGALGSVKPGHKYLERKPKKGGKGWLYRYRERVQRAMGEHPELKEKKDLLAPSTRPPEHEKGETVEVYDPKTRKWEKAQVRAVLPSPRAGFLHGSGGPSDYDFWVEFLKDGHATVSPFLIRPASAEATKGMMEIDDFDDLTAFAFQFGLEPVQEPSMDGITFLKGVTTDLEKAKVGYVKPGHKYYRRVPKPAGGYLYYYTKEDWQAKRGHESPPEEEREPTAKPALEKWLTQWKENEDRIDTLKGEIKLLATHNRKLYDSIKPQMEKLPGMVYETNSLIARFTSSEELSARPSYKEAFQTALNKVNGRTRELLVRLLDETKKLLKKEELTVVRKSVDASDKGDTVQSLLSQLLSAIGEGNQELRNILLQAKKEAGNMGTDNTEKALGALIEMDPLRAAQEGESGLDMLKNLTGELEKARKAKCSHLNPDGTFKGGFDGCVAHFQTCKGLGEPNAKRMCAYIGRKAGKIPGGTKKSLSSMSQVEMGDILLTVAAQEYDDEDSMVKAMEDALSKALQREDEEDKGPGTEKVPPMGSGLEMLRSVTSNLRKGISEASGPRGVSFKVKGEKIQAGITGKVAELNQKLTKLLARHPNCDVDDESKDYPQVVKTGPDTAETLPLSPAPECPNKQEHWEIRDLRRKIDRLQRTSRNLNPKETFLLGDWDLQEYGL